METLSLKEWRKYKDLLAKCSKQAEDEFLEAVLSGKLGGVGFGNIPKDVIIDYAYGLVTKYGEASSAAACVFYDELAEASGVLLPAAVPAETANIHEVAKAVNGAAKSGNDEIISSAVGRLVKQAGQDTTLQNAKRDGAEFAWIPSGDTCAYCLGLAAIGWQTAGKSTIRGNHAEHIHGNCDCAYAIRFNESTKYQGYDPARYADMFDMYPGDMPASDELNALRREVYDRNKDKINAQKRSAYAKRKERESSKAEEIDVN